MIRSAMLAASLSFSAAAAACAQSVPSAPQPSEAIFSLSATGEVRVAPDQATVSAGVVTRADTANQALRENAQRMARVFDELDEAGVAEHDMQTSQLSVTPVYSRVDSRSASPQEPRIIAYEARNTVTALVRDLDRLGLTIDAVFDAGANSLNGVNFSSSNADEARNEARRRAVAALNDRRDLYAEAAGFAIVRITQFSESGGYAPRPAMMMRAESFAADAAPTPVAAGELTISVTVNASWQIDG